MRIVRAVDLYKKISNLEKKVLLDIGTGPDVVWVSAYFRALSEMGKNAEEFVENVFAIDIDRSFLIPEGKEHHQYQDTLCVLTHLYPLSRNSQ